MNINWPQDKMALLDCICHLPEIQNGGRKPEMLWNQRNTSFHNYKWNFNGYTHIYAYARLRHDTADIGGHPKQKCSLGHEPEVESTITRKVMQRDGVAIPFKRLPYRTFSTMPDLGKALPTWPDIGRHSELNISATKREVIWFLADVGPCRQLLIWIRQCHIYGVSHWNRFASSFPLKLFPLSVFVDEIQDGGSQCGSMSALSLVPPKSSMVENV